jgi:hypothetical protein
MQIYKKKTRNYSVRLFKFTLILFAFSYGLVGCYKKKDTILKVFVFDNVGSIVKGANVDVFAEPTDTTNQNPISLNSSTLTDENGIAVFNLNANYESGQTGVAIVKVKATFNNKIGESVVQIVEEIDNECNIQIE